jgi:hypothetical protein
VLGRCRGVFVCVCAGITAGILGVAQVRCLAHAKDRARTIAGNQRIIDREYCTHVFTCECYRLPVRLMVCPELVGRHFVNQNAVVHFVESAERSSCGPTPTRYGAVVSCRRADHRLYAEIEAVGGELQAMPFMHPDCLFLMEDAPQIQLPDPDKNLRYDPSRGSFLRPTWLSWPAVPPTFTGALNGKPVTVRGALVEGVRDTMRLTPAQVSRRVVRVSMHLYVYG